MKVRTRSFNDPENPDKYETVIVEQPKAVELNGKEPCLVWRMGAFQTEDALPRTEAEVRAWLNSGEVPLLNAYTFQMSPGATRDAVIKYFTPGVTAMCRDYFAYGDEIGGHIPALRNAVRNMRVVSCDKVDTPFLAHREDFHRNLNEFHTYENTDFVRRFYAPYMGDFTTETDKDGKEFIYINKPFSTRDIAHNLTSLVVASNSAGAEMSVKDGNALQKTMRESGFNVRDQHTIASSVRNVMFGNIVPVEQLTGPRATTVVFEGFRDLVAESINPWKVALLGTQIDRHAPPAYRQKLRDAMYMYYQGCEDWLTDWGTMTPPPAPDVFDEAPFLMFQRLTPNMMRVISDVPNHRMRWVSRDPFLAKELHKVSGDGNRHHTGFYICQGDPPHHLPEVTHQVMREALAIPLLTKTRGAKRMDDFFTRNSFPEQNPRSAVMRALIRDGLDRAESPNEQIGGAAGALVAS